MGSVALGARILLALVFGTAAAGKFADQPGTRRALADFGAPRGSLKALGLLLPLAELATAVALLFQPSAQWGALAAAILVALFVAGIARAMARGEAPDCHCFGQISSSPAGPRTLVRNAVLIVPAIFLVAYGPGTSIDAWVSARSTAELVAFFTGVAGVALGAMCVRIWLTNRRLRDDLERANKVLAAFPAGLPIGADAPDFALPDIEGRTTTLDALLAEGKPVALVFVGANCDACHIMLPDLARWQTTVPDRVTIALVGAGKKEELRQMAKAYGLSNVLVQKDAETFHAYHAAATPSVVIVGPDGRITSPTRSTHALVETVVRRAVRSNGVPAGQSSAVRNEGSSNATVLRLPDPTDAPADST
jgi:cytochrome oxidase Cu insertion factor (SCO1/SenC/PrrC family)